VAIHGVPDQLLPDGTAAAQGRRVAQDPEAVPAPTKNVQEQLNGNGNDRALQSRLFFGLKIQWLPCPRQSDVGASEIGQEADGSCTVRPDG